FGAPPDPYLSPRRKAWWTTRRTGRQRLFPAGSALARLHSVPRVFPRRQRLRPGREPPDGLDGTGRPALAVWGGVALRYPVFDNGWVVSTCPLEVKKPL